MMAEYEKGIIADILNHSSSIREAARSLGISHTALLNKLKKLKMRAVTK
jgi:transcriptional regulator of aroF, aroG, tyrA and aromatic amino acid transport